MVEAPWQLGALLRHAAPRLGAAGAADGAHEARVLWSAASGRELSDWQEPDELIGDEAVLTFQGLLARRLGGEPLAHVTGLVGFRHLTLRSDARALIPRPETEGLVGLVLDRMAHGVVADLGTGSGCIALSLADEGHYTRVIGVDRSREALGLASENRRRTGHSIDLVSGEWTAALATNSLDVLVSNPPYLTDDEYATLDIAVKHYEPRSALPSGVDGLLDTRRLIDEGRRVVRAGGWLALELDCRRAEASAALARAAGWNDVSVQDDLFGRARFLLARRSDTA